MIERKRHINRITRLLKSYPVVAIIGARQVGKTTLAKQIIKHYPKPSTVFDLEKPSDLSRLADPLLALEDLKGLVIIDEIQRKPDLFTVLRVLADRTRPKTKFLILGSAAPELLRQSSESLAGRISYYELEGFSLNEVGNNNLEKLWIRGSLPKAFLAKSIKDCDLWRSDFIRSYLERDIPQLGITISSATLQRFFFMLAHYHGQTWNSSEFGRSFGVSDTTVRNYLDILTSTFIVKQLSPYTENLGKRQVKSPKIYISDSGILHSLLNIKTKEDIEIHPKLGASWEGFILAETIKNLEVDQRDCFFWATHNGAELDLVIQNGRIKLGFEFKRTVSPKITPSMRIAMKDLNLRSLDVIHAGKETYYMDKKIRAVAAGDMTKILKPLK